MTANDAPDAPEEPLDRQILDDLVTECLGSLEDSGPGAIETMEQERYVLALPCRSGRPIRTILSERQQWNDEG